MSASCCRPSGATEPSAIFSRRGERGNPVRASRNRVGRKASRPRPPSRDVSTPGVPAQEMAATARILSLVDLEQPRIDNYAAQDLPYRTLSSLTHELFAAPVRASHFWIATL